MRLRRPKGPMRSMSHKRVSPSRTSRLEGTHDTQETQGIHAIHESQEGLTFLKRPMRPKKPKGPMRSMGHKRVSPSWRDPWDLRDPRTCVILGTQEIHEIQKAQHCQLIIYRLGQPFIVTFLGVLFSILPIKHLIVDSSKWWKELSNGESGSKQHAERDSTYLPSKPRTLAT